MKKKLHRGLGLLAILGALGVGITAGHARSASNLMNAAATDGGDGGWCRPFLTSCTYAHECCSNMCFAAPVLGVGLCL